MSRTIIFLLITGFLLFTGCSKDKDKTSCKLNSWSKSAPDFEVIALQDSLEKYGVRNAIQHPRGFFYQVVEKGSGSSIPDLCSPVTFDYRGGFFNGKGFDSTLSQPVVMPLVQTIPGFQLGVPLVKETGKINLFIPPSLGYGSSSRPNIPANSYLVFSVDVRKVN